MGTSCFQAVFLVSALLVLAFYAHGSGRKMMVLETFGQEDGASVSPSLERNVREMIQLDYVDAGPNYNAKGGYLLTPTPMPPSPPSPSPSPSPED